MGRPGGRKETAFTTSLAWVIDVQKVQGPVTWAERWLKKLTVIHGRLLSLRAGVTMTLSMNGSCSPMSQYLCSVHFFCLQCSSHASSPGSLLFPSPAISFRDVTDLAYCVKQRDLWFYQCGAKPSFLDIF